MATGNITCTEKLVKFGMCFLNVRADRHRQTNRHTYRHAARNTLPTYWAQ